MKPTHNIDLCLARCASLQSHVEMFGGDQVAGELIDEISNSRSSKLMNIILCRLLFTGCDQQTLRSPYLGEPSYVGETEENQWPLSPIHVHKAVPFLIVRNWLLAGVPEPPSWYLAYCLLHGRFSEVRYNQLKQERLNEIALDFIRTGPWLRPLTPFEETFILAQTLEVAPAMD